MSVCACVGVGGGHLRPKTCLTPEMTKSPDAASEQRSITSGPSEAWSGRSRLSPPPLLFLAACP